MATFAVKFSVVLEDTNGDPQRNTPYQLFLSGTTTPATVYEGRTKTPFTGTLQSNSMGNATFWVDPGYYDIKVSNNDAQQLPYIGEDDADTLSDADIGVKIPSLVDGKVPTEQLPTVVTSGYVKPSGGIPSSDLAAAVQTSLTKANNSATATALDAETAAREAANSQIAADLTNEAQARAAGDATNAAAIAGKYVKPGSGIPKTDLAVGVQDSLGKADTAVQVDVDGKLDAAILPTLNVFDVREAADQAAMLALTGTAGKTMLVIRADTPGSLWIQTGSDPAMLGSWTEIALASGVASVNGQTGVVTGLATTTQLSAEQSRAQAAEALAAQKSANLSDLASVATARTNLGLGDSATRNVGTAAGSVAAGDDTRITGAAQKSANLADLGSVVTARTNLGLGSAALRAESFFDLAGAAAAVQTSSVQKAANLSDLASIATARNNLGLGDSATRSVGTTTGTVAAGDDARIIGSSQKSANLSDLSNVAQARINLGLGDSATKSVGTAVGTVAAGDDARFTNTRTPTDGTVTWAKLATGLVGNTANTLAAGDDPRFTNPATGPNVRAVASDTSAAFNDVVGVDASSANRQVTLPTPVAGGRIIHVKKRDPSANTVTVVGTIDGGTNYVLSVQNETVSLVPDSGATGYWVV